MAGRARIVTTRRRDVGLGKDAATQAGQGMTSLGRRGMATQARHGWARWGTTRAGSAEQHMATQAGRGWADQRPSGKQWHRSAWHRRLGASSRGVAWHARRRLASQAGLGLAPTGTDRPGSEGMAGLARRRSASHSTARIILAGSARLVATRRISADHGLALQRRQQAGTAEKLCRAFLSIQSVEYRVMGRLIIGGIPFDQFDWETGKRKEPKPPTERQLAFIADQRASRTIYDRPEYRAKAMALPALQQIALLNMRESYVRRRVVNRLMLEEGIQDNPRLPDYATLVERGLAIKKPFAKWHEPTKDGRVLAAVIERELCRRYDIHLMSEGNGSQRFTVSYSCVCGDWSFDADKRDNCDASARRDFARHCEAARATKQQKPSDDIGATA